MKIIRTAGEMLSFSKRMHRRGQTFGFVPTLGALHRGHVALIERAQKESRRTVVFIFVNPLQFGPSEDYLRYPRPARKDERICRQAGVDILYHPTVREMYPE